MKKCLSFMVVGIAGKKCLDIVTVRAQVSRSYEIGLMCGCACTIRN